MFNLTRLFRGSKLAQEAFDAYIDKLPDKIAVEWFRDGKFIVGSIHANGDKFMTQAKSAEEFIEMVNDTVYTVYEIPKEYLKLVSQARQYSPSHKQLEELGDASIRRSNFRLARQLKIA